MTDVNWKEEVEKIKEELIADTKAFLQIRSVLDEASISSGAPFGKGISEALTTLLEKGEKDGFQSKNVDGYAGHLEMGNGEELIGILCHIDVVPEGEGWTSPPYSAEVRDGKIFARGAVDDKGPTVAAYYAMKIVKNLNLPLSKRVRMIIGTDEESSWRCVNHYFEREEMPTMGFAPDADFPIIYAEKGITDLFLIQEEELDSDSLKSTYHLHSFKAGARLNMVPDYAEAKVTCFIQKDLLSMKEAFARYLEKKQLTGRIVFEGNEISIEVHGISAHGSTPEKGRNAGLALTAFLNEFSFDQKARMFLSFLNDAFVNSTDGKKVGIACSDNISGSLTVNSGLIDYDNKKAGRIGLNLRYPVTADFEEIVSSLNKLANKHSFTLSIHDHMKPHHVAKDHPLIKILSKVYEEQTGERAELISIGGGTYARSLHDGVAFGPLFPGSEEVAHQKDEYIKIEDLLKAAAIYAQAIYELAK
ncbi:dipeptidase PepV [Bacillus taeanensis]|uniref:Dipeptidase PepV n=1 Tax=Bacillus taeanensis TaxID=273032 RepID=A0A366Y204_9BACI|nr:dipeptidase PepV [Bacillus taeanensis]RBW71415.1 dipeptidase PepV [Bacillus taeanensis]